MMRLKSRRKAQEVKIVLDGEEVEPYELPQDPAGDEIGLHAMERQYAARAERQRTAFRRLLRAVVDDIHRRKGRGFEATLFGRYVFECHRIERGEFGRKVMVELYRRGGDNRWDLTIELWRAA